MERGCPIFAVAFITVPGCLFLLLQRKWSEFVSELSAPKTWAEMEERILTNLVYFKTNYFMLALVVFVWSLYVTASLPLRLLHHYHCVCVVACSQAVKLWVVGRVLADRVHVGLLIWPATDADRAWLTHHPSC